MMRCRGFMPGSCIMSGGIYGIVPACFFGYFWLFFRGVFCFFCSGHADYPVLLGLLLDGQTVFYEEVISLELFWYHYMIIGFTLFILAFLFYTRKYCNPYKLTMVFGKKGSGKSTFMVKTAVQQLRKGKTVYSTVEIPGTRLFNVDDIGRRNFPEYSIVLIDEVGMIWDNRQYKNFRTDVRDWFKLQRHNKVTVYLFSQTFDVDVKLRNLTDAMYLITCHFSVFSVARKIKRGIVIVNPDGQSEARIADSLEFVSPLLSFFGARSLIFTWIPNWTKYFDSFELPDRPLMDYVQQDPFPRARLIDHVKRGRFYCRQLAIYVMQRRRSGSSSPPQDIKMDVS